MEAQDQIQWMSKEKRRQVGRHRDGVGGYMGSVVVYTCVVVYI